MASPATLRDLALATPPAPGAAPTGLERLPAEWAVVHAVSVDGVSFPQVVVGPNGVFTVSRDDHPEPATIGSDGLYRSGQRVTTPVKEALQGAHDLRRSLGADLLPYPILVVAIEADRHHLDRLGVVPGDGIAEHIWSHPGRPLGRTRRRELEWHLRHLQG